MREQISLKLIMAIVAGVLVIGGAILALTNSSSRFGSRLGELKDKLPPNIETNVDKAENDAGIVTDVPEKTIATEKPDLILNNTANIPNPVVNIPSVFPPDQLPWQQGPSQQ